MNPDTNFFTALFNIDQSEIDSLVTRTDAETVVYELQLKRKELSCPYCGGPMIGHGHKLKKIDHPVLRNRKGIQKTSTESSEHIWMYQEHYKLCKVQKTCHLCFGSKDLLCTNLKALLR